MIANSIGNTTEEFWAFDRLPFEVRQALRESPVDQSAVRIFRTLHSAGSAKPEGFAIRLTINLIRVEERKQTLADYGPDHPDLI